MGEKRNAGIICTTITQPIREIAKELGISPSYANNLYATWLSFQRNPGLDFYPKANTLKSIMKRKEEIELAIPEYSVEPYEEGKSIASTKVKNGKYNITLREVFKEKPLEYFFDYILGNLDNATSQQKKIVFERLAKEGYTIDKIRDLVQDGREAYRFLLWHEMSHVENDDYANYWKDEDSRNPNWRRLSKEEGEKHKNYLTEDKLEIEYRATLDAIKKAEKWRAKNPRVRQTNDTSPSSNGYIQAADITYSNDLPKIGTDVVSINRESPRVKANRAFSPIIRKDRESYIARQFSSILDSMYEERMDELREELNLATQNNDTSTIEATKSLIKKFNDPETGRRALAEDVTVEEIIKRIKEEWEIMASQTPEELDADFGEGQGNYMLNEYNKVLEHFDVLLEDAATLIEKRESIRIVFDKQSYHTKNESIEVTGGTINEDIQSQDSEEEDNGNDDEDSRVNNSEGWGFKVRFVDPHSTISKVVKRVLSNIIKEDNFGGVEYDDLGNTKYLDEENAHAILMSGLADMVDADDFSVVENGEIVSLPALEKLVPRYPWVNQIIEAIKADNDLASKFFADFRKEFISYWAQKDGKTFMLNESLAVDDTRNAAINSYESGSKLSKNSLYNSDRTINNENADKGIELADNITDRLSEYDEDDDSLAKDIIELFHMLGLDTTETVVLNTINSTDGLTTMQDIINDAKNIFSRAKDLDVDSHLIDSFKDEYTNIATIIGIVSETGGISSFRSGDKTFYSYSASNYLDGLFKSLKSNSRRDDYLRTQYKVYDWFFSNGEWNNEWLKQIEEDDEVRSMVETMELNNLNDNYYTEWTPTQIKTAFIRQYFAAGYNPGSKKQFGWYNFPIFSDSPVVKFIKFTRYTEDYKATIIPLLTKVVKQELSRIKLVQERKKKGIPAITNFDKNGEKFHFFPELNNFTFEDGSEFMTSIVEAVRDNNIELADSLCERAMTELMERLFNKFYNKLSEVQLTSITDALKADGVISAEEGVKEALEEYFYNQMFATSQIIQITTTDLAYYKNLVEFQKRYKEVYGAGTKLNTNSKYGKKTERTIYLSDQVITAFGYNNIKSILNEARKEGKLNSIDVDFILTKFKDINVTDAQAYRTLESFRSILDMLGKWTPEMEETYNRIQKGEWDMADFNTVWQTIKPFVFTQVSKPNGLGGRMKVPHQNKNSEFLLMAMYSMFSKKMNESPVLRGLNRFMKENDIDVAQFESSAKVGGQGIVDISVSPKALERINSEYGNFKNFKKAMDNKLEKGTITQEEYNKTFEDIMPTEQEVYDILNKAVYNSDNSINEYVVHELPYSDYVVQQPTPEHLFDTVAIYGSQFRNLVVSDISEDAEFEIHDKKLNKSEILKLYQSLIVENLLDSYSELKDELSGIEGFQKALLRQVKGNPKFGRDIVEALQIVEIVNPITGTKEKVFNIPLNNPSTTIKIQELVNSLFKSRITKQHIKGGNAILVSDYGLTKDLNIVYGKDGNIEGVECYLPAYSKQFYEPFLSTDDNGNQFLDVSKMPKELRKLVGYRI